MVIALFMNGGAVPVASAAGYPSVREFGDPLSGAGARCAAMGWTGLARAYGVGAVRLNPGLLGDLTQRELSLTAGPSLLTEKFVESSTHTRLRDGGRWDLAEFSLGWPLVEGRLWGGMTVSPAYDFHYKTSFAIFGATGSPASLQDFQDGGAVWEAAPAVGFGFSPDLSVGLSYVLWRGRERIGVERFHVSSGVAARWEERAAYRGAAVRAGLRLKRGPRLNLGLVFQPQARMRRRFELVDAAAPGRGRSGEDRWTLPARAGMGFSYRAAGSHPTELNVEGEWTDWDAVRINGRRIHHVFPAKPVLEELAGDAFLFFGSSFTATRRYRDAFETRVGVEHFVRPGWCVRFGFRHSPSFSEAGVEATFLSMGLGYGRGKRWAWDAAAEMGKRDYQGDGILFPKGRRVDETFTRLLFSSRWRW